MYLKRIEISGFKSFVDDTALEFSKGISAIIGPNGCGKSNVLDAMRWVLGEQNPRLLRAEKMADIIWNGSSTRKATSFAEASLIFSEAENIVSMNFHEVTITRRLYRSGESEYLVNKTPCRLKDIETLFMDTGIGSHAYSIMEQGKIDQLLAMKPEQRRFLFEEAAGITKYQTRKEEAIRKLQRTEENLLRLNDIITETKRHVSSIERQAKQAQRYKEYEEELRKLEVSLSKKEYDRLSITWQEMSKKLTGLKDKLELMTATITKSEAEFESLKTRLTEIDTQLANLQQQKFDTDSQIEKSESQVQIARAQVTNADEILKSLQTEILALEEKSSELKTQKDQLTKQKDELNEKIEKQKLTIAEQQAELANIISTLHTTENSINDALKAIVDGNEKSAQLQGEMGAIGANLEGLLNRRKEVGKNISDKEQSAEELKARVDSAIQKVKELEKSIAQTQTKIKEANKKLEDTAQGKNTQLNELEKIKQDLTTKQTRRASLLALKESYEGYQSGTKAVLQGKKSKIAECSGVVTTVAELIRTDSKYELAVEIALGNALNYLVTKTVGEAKSVLGYLEKLKSGMATILPLENIHEKSQKAIPIGEGVIGRASELVKYDSKYKPVIQVLLGHVLIVKDLDNALKLLSDETSDWLMVTLAGERVNGYGAISGGAVKTPGLLAQDREIEELGKQIGELETELKSTLSKIGTFDSQLTILEQERAQLQQQSHSFEIAKAEAQRDAETYSTQQKHVASEIDMLSTVRENNLTEEEQQKARQRQLQDDIKSLEKELTEAQKKIEKWRKAISDLGQKRETQGHSITQMQVDLATLENQTKNTDEQISQIGLDLETQQAALAQKVEQKKTAETRKKDAEKLILETQEKLKSLLEQKDSVAQKLSSLQEEKVGLDEKVSILDKQLSESRRDHSQVQNEVHELEMQTNQHKWQIDSLHQRILETYHIDVKEPVDVGEVDLTDETAVGARVQELKQKIDRLGPVNVGALQEYEEEQKRYDFLKEQEDDEKTAITSLRNTITHINSTTKQLFIDTFTAAQANFHEVFRRLFRGGNAKLVMLDSENPLESGIDVVVQPPGKNLQSITLLSGGEKAMSAIALLFSIYLLKPAPVCVLDEIDAPLDDVNIGRFTDLVHELVDRSQFVVITHNKRTMEAADNLYGITMEEPGVSKVVAVKLTGEALYDKETLADMEFNKRVLPQSADSTPPATN